MSAPSICTNGWCRVTRLAVILVFGLFVRRAILEFPELEHVAWILVVLGGIVAVGIALGSGGE